MLVDVAGASAAGIAVSSMLLWAVGFRGTSMDTRLGKLASARRAPVSIDSPFGDRVLVPFFDNITRFVVGLLPTTFVSRISDQLVAAGQPMTTQAFFTLVVITGMMFPVVPFALIVLAAGKVTSVAVLGSLVLSLFGVALPFFLLRRAVRARKLTIWKSLADAFDLITVSVEAGLGLDAALRHVAEKLKGPLRDEIAEMLREVSMGRPRREALEDMAARVDVKELETFVNAVIQADQLGTSLGRILRSQGVTLRIRRRQRAEESSRRAPVKLVFPLVLFIMPTFFIVTLGPIFVRVVEHLKG